jgi:hypothetical protein
MPVSPGATLRWLSAHIGAVSVRRLQRASDVEGIAPSPLCWLGNRLSTICALGNRMEELRPCLTLTLCVKVLFPRSTQTYAMKDFHRDNPNPETAT